MEPKLVSKFLLSYGREGIERSPRLLRAGSFGILCFVEFHFGARLWSIFNGRCVKMSKKLIPAVEEIGCKNCGRYMEIFPDAIILGASHGPVCSSLPSARIQGLEKLSMRITMTCFLGFVRLSISFAVAGFTMG